MVRKQSILRTIALLLAVVCLFFAMANALPRCDIEHNCTGADCLICLCVSLREQLAGMMLLLVSLVYFLHLVFICTHFCVDTYFSGRWTPVCLKVKLSN